MRTIDYGVFMPVCNTGWIPSTTTPPLDGSYQLNLRVARLAEELGFDFTLSQANWKGKGGPSRAMDDNLESLTTSAGLAQGTQRIGVWSTAHTMTYNPGVLAKIYATQDQISGGRTGLNVVAGGSPTAEGQFGLWHGLDHPGRYRRAAEWVQCLKALWTQDHVDFDGEFFTLTNCESWPKPRRVPPMISAANSDVGLRFAARELDGSLIEGTSRAEVVELGQRAKRICAEEGGHLKTYCVFMLIPGETDADAQARIELYNEGRDLVAITGLIDEWTADGKDNSFAERIKEVGLTATAVSTGTIAGSVETIVQELTETIEEADLDSAVFIMPDFIDDLEIIGREIIPGLARNGIVGTHLSTTTGAAA